MNLVITKLSGQMLMLIYKRSAVDREVTFNAPKYTCYACNDTGIINNSDKLINNHLPDYDIDDKGRRFSGQDLALICYCNAANPQYDIDGQIISHGYRDSDGHIRNNVGVDIPIDIVRDIHNMRKESWTKTEKLMNKLIQKNIKNQKATLPPEVQKVKDQLANFQIKSL